MKNIIYYTYFIYAKRGRLIYVGCTANVDCRILQHRNDKHWRKEIALVESFEHASEVDAREAEADALRKFRPKYNIYIPKEGTTMKARRGSKNKEFVKRMEGYAKRREAIVEMATQEPRPSLKVMADHFNVTRARMQQLLSQMGIPGRRRWAKPKKVTIKKTALTPSPSAKPASPVSCRTPTRRDAV